MRGGVRHLRRGPVAAIHHRGALARNHAVESSSAKSRQGTASHSHRQGAVPLLRAVPYSHSPRFARAHEPPNASVGPHRRLSASSPQKKNKKQSRGRPYGPPCAGPGRVAAALVVSRRALPATPPPFRREKPNVPAQRSGEPFFQQKRFPVPRISVPGPKHTFLLVVL